MNRFIKLVGWLFALTILFAGSQTQAQSRTNSATGSNPAGKSVKLTNNDIDQLLSSARQAMARGDIDEADRLLRRAEAAKPTYPVLHFGDTPARVRRDLEKLALSRPGGGKNASVVRANMQLPGQVVNPFTVQQTVDHSELKELPPHQAQSLSAAPPLPSTSDDVPHVATPSLGANNPSNDAGAREICDAEILAARRALIVGDLSQASRHLEKAKQCGVIYEDHEDSPDRVAQSLAEFEQLEAAKDNSTGWKYSYAKFLVGQGEFLLGWGDLESAERAASEAAGLIAMIGSTDQAPHDLMGRIAQSRRGQKGSPEQNRMILDQAVAPAVAAVPIDLTLPNLADSQETPRLAQLPGIPEPLPATDGDLPAEVAPSPTLVPEVMDAFALLQEGEVALRAGDRKQALQLFRLAHGKQGQLDAEHQQRLQDHLQMLSADSAANTSLPGATSLIDAASSGQNVIARQLSAEIGKRQAEAEKLRESEPKKSLEILAEAGDLVATSELDESTKTQLRRRLDMSVAKTEQYIKDHGAELELESSNKKALEDVERERTVKAQLRQKIAEHVDQFNQLIDENRFAEAEVVAKRLYEIAPLDPVAQQLWQQAKFIRRTMLNRELDEMSDEAVVKIFQDNKRTASEALKYSTDPINYNAETWANIEKRTPSTSREAYRTEREMEIHRKLETPVLPTYDDMPLSQVVEGLSKLAGINIHLDPRGLSQEGHQSDTPVSLHLDQEISLKSALNLILEPLHLTYMIKDEVLKITSEQIRDGELERRVYNVADLVIPIPNFVPSSNMGLQGLINDAYANMPFSNGSRQSGPVAMVPPVPPAQAGAMPPGALAQQFGTQPGQSSTPMGGGPGGLGGAANADFDSLIDLIVSTVEYDTWMENGSGEGEIQEFPTNLSLVVSQTQRVHEQIADLLEQLRRLQDLQVTIEVRFIRLSDNFFERVGMDFDFNISDDQDDAALDIDSSPSKIVGIRSGAGGVANPDTTLPNFNIDIPYRQNNVALPTFGGFAENLGGQFGFAILSDIEAYFLLQAAQGDSRANVLQAPKVTLYNGQQGIVADTSLRPFVISVIPVVGEFAAAQQPVIVVLSEGTLLTVQAVVSDDRKYVRLTLVPFFSAIGDVDTFTFEGSETTSSSSNTTDEDEDGNDESDENSQETIRTGTTVQLPTFQIITVATTVSVPDGGTVLLGGIKRLSEGRTEFGVPLLSKIPYVDRLFRNVGIGRQTDSLMMMVTPHIIIQEEEEERLGLSQD